jgi:hypothetical protein
MRDQLSRYSRVSCNTGFAVAVASPTSGGDYGVYVYSAGNVVAFVATAREDYSQRRAVNGPEPGGRERINLFQGFDADDPEQIKRAKVRLTRGDILVLASDGIKTRGVAKRLEYSIPRYGGGSLERYCEEIIAGSSRINFGRGRGQGFDDRTVMVLRVR